MNSFDVSENINVDGSDKRYKGYLATKPNPNIIHIISTDLWSDTNTLKCLHPDCKYETSKKELMKKHELMHVRKYPCSVENCQYIAQTKSNLTRHQAIHMDGRPHICDICQQAFRQKVHLQRHINYKHSMERFKCNFCDYLAPNIDVDLQAHIKRCHPIQNAQIKGLDIPLLECSECEMSFELKKDLQNHSKVHKLHGPELKFSCTKCSFVTDARSRLIRHNVVHTGEKRYSCSECKYKANQKEHVIRHMAVLHGIEKSSSNFRKSKKGDTDANNSDKISHGEKLHELNDDGKKKYPPSSTASLSKVLSCSRCDMSFARTISLYRHVKNQHSVSMMDELGAHLCVACSYSAPTYKALVSHMRKHNNQRSLISKQSSSSSSSSSNNSDRDMIIDKERFDMNYETVTKVHVIEPIQTVIVDGQFNYMEKVTYD